MGGLPATTALCRQAILAVEEDIEGKVGAKCPRRRLTFLQANKDLIKRAVKENEKKLQGTLVGSKILDSGTWHGWELPKSLTRHLQNHNSSRAYQKPAPPLGASAFDSVFPMRSVTPAHRTMGGPATMLT